MYKIEFHPSNRKTFKAVLLRQLSLYWNQKFFLLQNLSFFIVSVLLFHITANTINFEIYLVFLLFSLTLSFDSLLISDYNKRILEQFLLLGINLEVILIAKILAHVIFVGVPFIFVILLFDYSTTNLIPEFTTFFVLLLVVTNILLVNLFSSALCLISKQNMLVVILAIPFIIPTMIFASSAIHEVVYINILTSIFLLELPIFLISSAAIIKSVIRYQ
ncbi:MAG: ABC-type transport system involved in cytochrome c biogenesis, permease component [Candidatus Midichloria mitochondrii]|nr:heme exporter protein CcmB [Candidatus Midichloria mitochondrii]MDJ1256235.1 heme exporter protein CcmB [Candidatus Midichloria mitochondrii]MDJ1287910.1 heme exporter protein CcmB [Candidatus Midichloria mitochondrii]MDJ1298777.1 heme exporter protein CcmB [Candidatus Midichloria mitochondrii]MDJ1312998.1 heme exporter protein CcmB [Candidatus Midichloria mitochondrii]MDJ1583542.1 heme exporter protein CcmB [Candidatus Midichloria mitochondrii]